MASRRKEYQEYAKLRVMQLIAQKPQMTSRELAQNVGISNGSAYYLLSTLIDEGFIRLLNLKENTLKAKHSYLLTPKGIREKSVITRKVLMRKKQEFESLKEEIDFLEESAGNVYTNNKIKQITNKLLHIIQVKK